MREVCRLNLASYLCWNMHVGKQPAAMLAIKRSAGVAPEVYLRDYISHTPQPSANTAAHSGFETQRRHHQKAKRQVYQWPHTKDLCPSKILYSSIIQSNELRKFSQLHFWSKVRMSSHRLCNESKPCFPS